MTTLQFRVLYRQFLFRMVDLEILSGDGDVKRILGQFGALLIWMSSVLAFGSILVSPHTMPALSYVRTTWGGAHFFISTTMLAVGLFAVLSWDSSLPDRRDVLVLGPLPVRPRTLFLAKAAALGMALTLSVAAFNTALSFTWAAMHFPPVGSGTLASIRAFFAWWTAAFAGGAFVFCAALALQGVAAQLPRRYFLRLSSFLQIVCFGALFAGYFLEPSIRTPLALATPHNQRLLPWLPSYWFFGLFEQLNGWPADITMPGGAHHAGPQGYSGLNGAPAAVVASLAKRAEIALAIVFCVAAVSFLLSYLRSIRKIVEEPDIVPGAHGGVWLPPFGSSVHTAIVQFTVRSLMRSRQHRVILGFYVGIGCAIVTLFVRSGATGTSGVVPLMALSLLILCFWIAGTRVVISMPLDLRANWVFRITTMWSPPEYASAARRAVLVLAAAPVWLASAAAAFSQWPWRLAAGHMLVLVMLGLALVDLALLGFRKIPFTCSYLPGKSHFHLVFLVGIGLLYLSFLFARFERQSMGSPLGFAGLMAILAVIAAGARRAALAAAKEEEALVQFEDSMRPTVQVLGLTRDGVTLLP